MVIQRGKKNCSDQLITGSADSEGQILAAVTGINKKSRSAVTCRGTAAHGKISCRIRGLPAGGPYTITLSIQKKTHPRKSQNKMKKHEQIIVRNVLVGDVWILAGQSNMEGLGLLKDALTPHPHVRVFRVSDKWDIARDPLHELHTAVDPVHITFLGGRIPRAPHIGTGPGTAFGQRMREITRVPQGLIACAHGGTSMDHWNPDLLSKGGESLYGAMHRRFVKNGSKAAGMFWYQGCSDADALNAGEYREKMTGFINAVRRNFADPGFPVVMVQIGRVCRADSSYRYWNTVQEQQRILGTTIARVRTVPAVDLSLDDAIHISGKDQQILGRRAADAMASIVSDSRKYLPPIQPQTQKIVRNKTTGLADIVIPFQHVSGGLRSVGRVSGFSLVRAAGGSDINQIFRADINENKIILHTILSPENAVETKVCYGFGYNPVCTVYDAIGRPLPCFGPVYTEKNAVYAPMIRRMRVSAIQESARDLSGLRYPENTDNLNLTLRDFPEHFCNLHNELGSLAPKDTLVYFAVGFTCTEEMQTNICLGYDGPVKVWLDRAEVFHDPYGINPASIDKAEIPAQLRTGTHEILIALGSNHGAAWGIYLRIKRTDLSAECIQKGKDAYAVPTVRE